MQTISFDAHTTTDGKPYTRAKLVIKVEEHTLITVEMNVEKVHESQPCGEAAARVLDLAIQELETERDRQRHNAKQTG